MSKSSSRLRRRLLPPSSPSTPPNRSKWRSCSSTCNARSRIPGPLSSVNPAAVEKSIAITTFGAFLAAQQAAKRMEPKGRGAIFFTGASAGMKGFAQSAAFAMGKFGLRGLAQSAARELGPKGIHVAHFNIDGAVRSAQHPNAAEQPDSTLDPDAIAQTYIDVLAQPRNA